MHGIGWSAEIGLGCGLKHLQSTEYGVYRCVKINLQIDASYVLRVKYEMEISSWLVILCSFRRCMQVLCVLTINTIHIHLLKGRLLRRLLLFSKVETKAWQVTISSYCLAVAWLHQIQYGYGCGAHTWVSKSRYQPIFYAQKLESPWGWIWQSNRR